MRRLLVAALLACLAQLAQAADIAVVGLFPGKAVLVVDGGSPRTYSVGSTVAPGVKLTAASESGATLSFNGKLETLAIGQHAGGASSGNGSATLHADGRGHFVTQGQINGMTVNMLVDTGASLVALSASEAARLGINYKTGRQGFANTANGTAPVYLVKLDTVRVGDIVVHQIDAMVHEQGLPITLLGMSFLNRTEMRRDGNTMTLRRRY